MTNNLIEKFVEDEELNLSDEWDSKRSDFEDVIAAIRVHGKELLAIPGVLFVRAGLRFATGSSLKSRPLSSV